MKKLINSLLLFILIGCEQVVSSDEYVMHDDYFYTAEDKFYLESIDDEYFVIVKNDNKDKVINQLSMNGFVLTIEPYIWNIPQTAYYDSLNEILDCVVFTVRGNQDISKITDIVYSNNLYLTSSGEIIGDSIESNTLLVRMSQEDNSNQLNILKEYAIQHKYLIVEEMSRGFVKLACTNRTSGNSVEMANWFIEVAEFETADPVLSQPEFEL